MHHDAKSYRQIKREPIGAACSDSVALGAFRYHAYLCLSQDKTKLTYDHLIKVVNEAYMMLKDPMDDVKDSDKISEEKQSQGKQRNEIRKE